MLSETLLIKMAIIKEFQRLIKGIEANIVAPAKPFISFEPCIYERYSSIFIDFNFKITPDSELSLSEMQEIDRGKKAMFAALVAVNKFTIEFDQTSPKVYRIKPFLPFDFFNRFNLIRSFSLVGTSNPTGGVIYIEQYVEMLIDLCMASFDLAARSIPLAAKFNLIEE